MSSAQMTWQQEQEDKKQAEYDAWRSQSHIVANIERRKAEILDKMISGRQKDSDHVFLAMYEVVYPSSTPLEKALYHSPCATPEQREKQRAERLRYEDELAANIMQARDADDDAQLGLLVKTRLLNPYFEHMRVLLEDEALEQAERLVFLADAHRELNGGGKNE